MVLTSIDPFVQEIERHFDRLTQRSFGQGWSQGSGAGMPMDGIPPSGRGRAPVRPAGYQPGFH